MLAPTRKSLRTLNWPNFQSQQLQKNAEELAARVNQAPQNSQVITATLLNGNNVIVHKLGRIPTRWTVRDVTGAAFNGYRVAWDSRTLTLSAVVSGVAPVVTLELA